MADRDLSRQRVQLLLVEDLRDEAHVAYDREPPLVRDCDARRLLPTVLEGEEPEVGETRDVPVLGPDSEDPAHLVVTLPGGAELCDLHSEEGSAARRAQHTQWHVDVCRDSLHRREL